MYILRYTTRCTAVYKSKLQFKVLGDLERKPHPEEECIGILYFTCVVMHVRSQELHFLYSLVVVRQRFDRSSS